MTLIEENDQDLRDTSEIIENYTSTVYTDMVFDSERDRGMRREQVHQSISTIVETLMTCNPNSVGPSSLRGLKPSTFANQITHEIIKTGEINQTTGSHSPDAEALNQSVSSRHL